MVNQTEQDVHKETLKARNRGKARRKEGKKKKTFFKFSAISKAAKGCILLYVL
jgi:hypothetical protein